MESFFSMLDQANSFSIGKAYGGQISGDHERVLLSLKSFKKTDKYCE
jgi:hypothetical protein